MEYDVLSIRKVAYLRRSANEVWSCSTFGRRREPSHLVRIREKGNLIEMYTAAVSVNLHGQFEREKDLNMVSRLCLASQNIMVIPQLRHVFIPLALRRARFRFS